MGDYETLILVSEESLLGYHPYDFEVLTETRYPGLGQCQMGSLTGAVASERVTEAYKGSLRLNGNQLKSAMAEGSLTATQTSGADTKVGHSDQAVENGIAVA